MQAITSWRAVATASAFLQSASLVAFILISDRMPNEIGKIVLEGATIIGLLVLVYKNVRGIRELAWVPLTIALEWPLIFHLVGRVAFPGLLSDIEVSRSYVLACLRSTSAVFIMTFAASVACLTCRWFKDRGIVASQ